MKPTFINIGPGRCATSWLHEILLAHPEIQMGKVKETEFFNSNFEKGYSWYEGHFADSGKTVAGEISNCYYVEPEVPQRVYDYDPDMKIIFNVRDPYTLMASFHGFGQRRGLEIGALEESLDAPIGKLMGSGFTFREKKNCLNVGDTTTLLDSVLLSKYLTTFLERFSSEQVYVFVYERLKTEKQQVLQEIYEFLGVDHAFIPPVADEVVNAAIKPKSKLIARTATSLSYLLRRMGAYGLLSKLHQSRLVKQLLYSRSDQDKKAKVDPRTVLDNATCQLLNEEIEKLKTVYPPLSKYWAALPSGSKAAGIGG